MKKLFVSTMVAVVAFGSVSALASSKLLEKNTVEIIGEKVYTLEEMLKMPNDLQKAKEANQIKQGYSDDCEDCLVSGEIVNKSIKKLSIADFFATVK